MTDTEKKTQTEDSANTVQKKKILEPEKTEITINDLISKIFLGYGSNGSDDGKDNAKKLINEYLQQQITKIDAVKKYNILILYDTSTMVKSDADNIYNAFSGFNSSSKPLLLILYSNGGEIGSAYLIGQLCRENSNGSFAIAIPRQAKSAATLLSCAADKIHMGSLSELGPIDPQINKLPALGLKNSIEHIAKLVKETPESAEMFAKYLHYSLKPIDLGYYERVAESAVQYAEKLLNTHAKGLPQNPAKIANELVYTYKDHGFVIDIKEAQKIFGKDIIQVDTEEYQIGNQLYKDLHLIEEILNYIGYNFYFIGSLNSIPKISKK